MDGPIKRYKIASIVEVHASTRKYIIQSKLRGKNKIPCDGYEI